MPPRREIRKGRHRWTFDPTRFLSIRGALTSASLLLLLLLAVACEEGTPTPAPTSTSTPTPTVAPTPTITPALTPTSSPNPTAVPPATIEVAPRDLEPTPELEAAKALIDLVPEGFDTVVYLDIVAILEDPLLEQALEDRGLLGALGPAAGPIREHATAAALALGGPTALGVLAGTVSLDAFVDSLKAPGSEVQLATYEGFQIIELEMDLGFARLNIPVGLLDEGTAAFAVSLSTDSPAIDAVRSTIDVARGAGAGTLANPVALRLIESVPAGFAMGLTTDCDLVRELAGCTALAVSAYPEANMGRIDMAIEFVSDEAAAEAAEAILLAPALGNPGPFSALDATGVWTEGTSVLASGRASIDSTLEAAFELAGF